MAFTLFSIFVLLAVAFVAFWFFALPKVNRRVEHEAMVASLRRGDRVVTAAGLEGTVVELGDEQARVDLDAGPSVTVAPSSLRSRLEPQEPT